MSNHDPFPKDDAFRTRITKYWWESMNELINCKMKLYPLAFHELLLYYDIYSFTNKNINSVSINLLVSEIDELDNSNNTLIDLNMDMDLFNW